MQKYTIEFIGTFFFTLTFALVAMYATSGPLAGVAIGLVYAVMLCTGAHFPGVHFFNPAVSLGIFLRGKLPGSDLPWYITAQLIGAVAGVLTAKAMLPGSTPTAFATEDFAVQVLIAEFVFTFGLVWVVILTSSLTAGRSNLLACLAAGGFVLAGYMAIESISLGLLNPAVSLGALVSGQINVTGLGILIVAQIIGGVAAGLTVTNLFTEEELK